MNKSVVMRTTYGKRLLHWLNAVCFFLVGFSGLSFAFPSFEFFGRVLGTPQTARMLHPILGVVVFLCLFIMFFKFVKGNLFQKTDLLWFKNIDSVLLNLHGKDLHIGKYNAGQKILFWCIMTSICVLLLSGLIIWREYFSDYFSVPVLRVAMLAHSAIALALMLLVLGHIYFGIWVRGSITAMITGYVSLRWARSHHSRWYEQIMDKKTKSPKIIESKQHTSGH
ncbi:formate dehydrogenase subunit gamma [Acetobacteraceae bacterium]|nr:formate dehydrogenase subunit gamma [Acetobacteraceae bacterium]